MTAPTPMRVAVVARAVMPLHGVGGLERSVRDLVRHLARRGVRVTLITPPPTVEAAVTPADFLSPLIELVHVPYVTFPLANRKGTTILDRSTAYLLFGLRAGRTALDLVRRGEVNVVHGFGASVLGYALARTSATAPLVFNPQGLEEFGATAPSQALLKRIGYAPLRRAVRTIAHASDCILATDAALEPMVQRHLHPPPNRVRVVPNGIDLDEAAGLASPIDGAAMRRQQGIGTGEFLLLSAGRLEANKGLDVLARALATSARRSLMSMTWRWAIVGAGPFRRALERRIRKLGLFDRAVFAGRASERDLHGWYEAADVFVHPTLYEGSSLVTLEAMAHRRPVIASRAGGLPDKVRPGVTGWLVPPGDADALAAAIDEAVSRRDSLVHMGEAGADLVRREFAWPAIASRQIAIYEELVTGRMAKNGAGRLFPERWG
jgi:glycosyltransferase involved in cell wall biosynthesis